MKKLIPKKILNFLKHSCHKLSHILTIQQLKKNNRNKILLNFFTYLFFRDFKIVEIF